MRRCAFAVVLVAGAWSSFAQGAPAPDPADIARLATTSSPIGNYLAGRVAADVRDTRAAATYLRAALRADPKNVDLLDRTFRIVLANGDVDEATVLAERLVAIDPTNRLARLALAVRAVKARQFGAARSQLGQALRGSMPDIVATLVTGWSWQGSGDTKKALETIDRLSGNELAELLRDLHVGLLADVAGQSREAERRLTRAYETDKSSFVIVDAYARRQARSGNTEAALRAYETLASSAAPRNPRIMAAVAAIQSGQPIEPVATNAREGVAEALFGFGQLANRTESAEIAMVYLNLALSLDAQHELALLTLADLHETLAQHERAIAAYERVPESSSFRDDIIVRIAMNLAAAERTDEAERRLQELIAKNPKDQDAVVALGNLLHKQKKYAEAAEVFGKAVALIGEPKPSDWTHYFARGVAYDAAKNWQKSQLDIMKAHELSPEQPVVLNYLGYSWVDRGLRLDEALGMIKKAVELRPNDGDIVDSLGWAYYRLGRHDEAVTELERAVELKPQSWEINDHLGDVYWKVGRKLEAKFQWLHAISLEPDEDKLVLMQRKLEEGLEPVEAELEAKRAAERAQPPVSERTEADRPVTPAPADSKPDRAESPRNGGRAAAGPELFGGRLGHPDVTGVDETLRSQPRRIHLGQTRMFPAASAPR